MYRHYDIILVDELNKKSVNKLLHEMIRKTLQWHFMCGLIFVWIFRPAKTIDILQREFLYFTMKLKSSQWLSLKNYRLY